LAAHLFPKGYFVFDTEELDLDVVDADEQPQTTEPHPNCGGCNIWYCY
jgi:hypothetical protein